MSPITRDPANQAAEVDLSELWRRRSRLYEEWRDESAEEEDKRYQRVSAVDAAILAAPARSVGDLVIKMRLLIAWEGADSIDELAVSRDFGDRLVAAIARGLNALDGAGGLDQGLAG